MSSQEKINCFCSAHQDCRAGALNGCAVCSASMIRHLEYSITALVAIGILRATSKREEAKEVVIVASKRWAGMNPPEPGECWNSDANILRAAIGNYLIECSLACTAGPGGEKLCHESCPNHALGDA